jgi:hypothetical protein
MKNKIFTIAVLIFIILLMGFQIYFQKENKFDKPKIEFNNTEKILKIYYPNGYVETYKCILQ